MARYGRRRYWDAFAQPSTYMVGARALEAKLALKAEGLELSPVEPVRGHRIAATFWGQAWCRNLTRYSDYENRMPRGRSYVRHGSVVHLEVEPGEIHALVSGSDLYRVTIRIEPLARKQWDAILGQCAGEIEDLVHLLRGEPPKRVMEIVTRPGDGLFPTPKEIELDCSCPDWADMCKHAAAVLYGVGVRLDHDPEQLFRLRSVDPNDLVSAVPDAAESDEDDALAGEDLSALFGIRLEEEDSPATSGAPGSMGAVRRKVSRKKVAQEGDAQESRPQEERRHPEEGDRRGGPEGRSQEDRRRRGGDEEGDPEEGRVGHDGEEEGDPQEDGGAQEGGSQEGRDDDRAEEGDPEEDDDPEEGRAEEDDHPEEGRAQESRPQEGGAEEGGSQEDGGRAVTGR